MGSLTLCSGEWPLQCWPTWEVRVIQNTRDETRAHAVRARQTETSMELSWSERQVSWDINSWTRNASRGKLYIQKNHKFASKSETIVPMLKNSKKTEKGEDTLEIRINGVAGWSIESGDLVRPPPVRRFGSSRPFGSAYQGWFKLATGSLDTTCGTLCIRPPSRLLASLSTLLAASQDFEPTGGQHFRVSDLRGGSRVESSRREVRAVGEMGQARTRIKPMPPPTPSFHCCFMEMLVHQICRRPDSFLSAFWSGVSSALALRDNSRNLKGLLDAANNSAYTTMRSFLDFSVDAWALL